MSNIFSEKKMTRKLQKSISPFTETLAKEKQTSIKTSKQNISTLKKIQNDKTQKLPNSSVTLIKKEISNNTNSDKSNSGDSEVEESNEEFKDEDEDIVMQDVTSEEEEDSTDSPSEDENSEEKSEEENSNEEEEGLSKDIDEDMEEKCNEIVEDTTKISSKKRQKEKGQKKSQDKTMSKETAEIKDPIPTPLLAYPQAEKNFRDYYMNQITKAFGEDLDQLRKKEVNLNSSKLEILIDTLESGISIFSDAEKELALLSFNNNNNL